MNDALPPVSEVIWCPDLQSAMDEIAALSFELHQWRVVFLSVEQLDQEPHHALSLTSVNGHSWTTRLLLWSVAISLKDEFRELFFSQQYLKVVHNAHCEDRIVMDIAGLLCVIRAHALMALNTWEYQRLDPTISDRDDDVTVLSKVVRLYVSKLCANEMGPSIVQYERFDSPDPPSSWRAGRRAAVLPLLFFHGIAMCHCLLIGPTPLFDDLDQLLLAAADYLNSSGGVSNPWLPSLGDSDMENHLTTDWLSPVADPAIPWEGSAHAMGINTQERGQVGELEILIYLGEDDMGFSIDQEAGFHGYEDADRKRVKQIMERVKKRKPASRSPPTLDTIDKVKMDPFGSFLSREELEEVAGEGVIPEARETSRRCRKQNAENPPPQRVLWPDEVEGGLETPEACAHGSSQPSTSEGQRGERPEERKQATPSRTAFETADVLS